MHLIMPGEAQVLPGGIEPVAENAQIARFRTANAQDILPSCLAPLCQRRPHRFVPC